MQVTSVSSENCGIMQRCRIPQCSVVEFNNGCRIRSRHRWGIRQWSNKTGHRVWRAIPENNISAGGCLKVWGLHVKYYFCGGEMANKVWGCTKFVRSITQKLNLLGNVKKSGEIQKYRGNKKISGNTKISGKPRSHVLISPYIRRRADILVWPLHRCEYLKKGT